MSTKPNKCIGTTIADGTMSSRAGGSTPSMDVISAKTLEVVLRVMHEFTLGERKHIGIGSVASVNSIFSACSLNSAFSIGCANSAFEVCSWTCNVAYL